MNFTFERMLTLLKPYLYFTAIIALVYLCCLAFFNYMENKCSDDCFAKGGLSYKFTMHTISKYGPARKTQTTCECMKEDVKIEE